MNVISTAFYLLTQFFHFIFNFIYKFVFLSLNKLLIKFLLFFVHSTIIFETENKG